MVICHAVDDTFYVIAISFDALRQIQFDAGADGFLVNIIVSPPGYVFTCNGLNASISSFLATYYDGSLALPFEDVICKQSIEKVSVCDCYLCYVVDITRTSLDDSLLIETRSAVLGKFVQNLPIHQQEVIKNKISKHMEQMEANSLAVQQQLSELLNLTQNRLVIDEDILKCQSLGEFDMEMLLNLLCSDYDPYEDMIGVIEECKSRHVRLFQEYISAEKHILEVICRSSLRISGELSDIRHVVCHNGINNFQNSFLVKEAQHYSLISDCKINIAYASEFVTVTPVHAMEIPWILEHRGQDILINNNAAAIMAKYDF